MARILVVDDNTALREAICEILEQAGHTTVAAADGRLAGEIHRRTPIDLVITDLFMPNTDGLEIVSQFRRDFPDVQLIAISGGGSHGMVELLTVARRLGAHRTFMKPMNLAELVAAVEELIGPARENDAPAN
jgi:CheY-like chemotaxis protein